MQQVSRRTFTGLALAAAAARPAWAAPDYVIPLQMAGGLPLVSVTLNGVGPHRFVVSTGSLFAAIDQNLARGFGARGSATPPVDLYTVRGGISEQLFKVNSLKLGGVWELKDIELIGRPFPADSDVQGVFPFPSLTMSTFDFDAAEMRIHRPRVDPPAGAGKASLVQYPGKVREPPIIRVDLGGQTLRMLVHTGSTGGVSLYPDAVRRTRLWTRSPSYTRRVSDREKGDYDTRVVRGPALSFAGQTLDRPIVTLMDPAYSRQDMVSEDGYLGMDVLRRFRITFDPVKQTAWFAPNAHLGEDFRYDRAGFDTEPEDGGRRVTRVDPASPAERAGLLLDDLVTGAGDGPADLDQLTAQPAGTTVRLQVERRGVGRNVDIVLEERL